ncbi:MAG: methyl-accepting chemotaxis protein, partial [Selenomonadaceae bacterium]|nr:methyl-accepting chemotaxis protein [Selenomonadaceae bacterium]
MGIRGRLVSLAILAAATIILIAGSGYYRASEVIKQNVEDKLMAKVAKESSGFEGWLLEKKRTAVDTAHFMETVDDSLKGERRFLNMHRDDEAVLNIAYADESGKFTSYLRKDFANIDVHTRAWYQKLMREKHPSFTNPYESLSIGDVAISAIAPVFKDGEFYGGVCVVIGIKSLLYKVGAMNYEGAGEGFLFDSNGHLIATATTTAGKSIGEISTLAHHEKEILSGGSLGISSIKDGNVISFSKVPSTGWILVFAVPEQTVYAPLTELRVASVALAILGLLLVLLMFKLCIRFSDDIVTSVSAVEKRAAEIATGNLAFSDLPIRTNDEIGELTAAFNTMTRDLRNLVGKTKEAAAGVASSSKDLLKYVEQNAESTREIASLASKVAAGMAKQKEDVFETAGHVDAAFSDMDDLGRRVEALKEDIMAMADGTAFILEDAKSIVTNGGDEEMLSKCFDSLFDALSTLSQNAEELATLTRTIEEKTGYIIDNINSMDTVTRETATNAATIETATEA